MNEPKEVAVAVRKVPVAQARMEGRVATSEAVTVATLAPALKLVEPLAFTKGHRGRAPSKGAVIDAAKVVRAQKELLRLSELRLVHQAARSRTSQDALAVLLGTSQPTVSRLSKQIALDPSILEPSPSEIINLRAVGQIDAEEMMEALMTYTYSAGQYDPTSGDGFIRGAWRQMEDALTAGLISDDEYERIARGAPVAKAARVVG